MNILIFPSGSMVAKEIYDSLKDHRTINIFGTDFDMNNYSSFYFENYISGCPMINKKEETIEFLNKIVRKYNIKYIYPAFDSIIYFLKENEKQIGAKCVAPSLDVINICNSKLLTYEKLSGIIPLPKIYIKKEITENDLPLYSKPIVGYGSRNHIIIKEMDNLSDIDISSNLILEYLTGKEYTIDCFSDQKGKVLCSFPRERITTSNGMSIRSKTYNLENINNMANKIQKVIKMRGAWFFQVKYNKNNHLKLLEIACRIPGSMCVNRMKGVNFPLLTILDLENENVTPLLYNNIPIDCFKIYKNYYKHNLDYDTVYCDLDDTLIIKNKVNLQLIKFLYKCINNKKKLVLLTRNKNPGKILHEFKINIFDNISILSKEKDTNNNYIELKSNYIKDIKSIFIDDSFFERNDVKQKCNINCFGIDNIELL